MYSNISKIQEAIVSWIFDIFCRIIGIPDSTQGSKLVKFSSFVFGRNIIMRREMEYLLKDELRLLAIKTRDRLSITQREMADKLVMSEYVGEVEHLGRCELNTFVGIN